MSEPMTVKESAYAKVNLFLEILGKREDGYHEIDTIMQTVSLADSVTVTALPTERTEVTLECAIPWIPKDERNTAYRAVQLFLRAIDKTAAVTVRIDKNIPTAAGLGGGSSDAAAVLRALNKLYGRPLPRETLCELGKEIGADVPFCIRGGSVRCRGIGELFTPCMNLAPCSLVIAIGRQRSQTPAAYGLLDENGYLGSRSADRMAESLSTGKLQQITENLYNAFESVILPANADAAAIHAFLTQSSGNLGTLMSGSGAAVFGIYRSYKQAEQIAAALRKQGNRAWSVYPVQGADR